MNKLFNKNRLLLIGNFGYCSDSLDGQTVKTRSIYELVHRNNVDVSYFDTDSFNISRWRVFSFISSIIVSKNIIIIPASRFIKTLFPLIFFIAKLFGKKILCIPVGGWWVWFLKDKRILCFMLRHINAILPQTPNDVEGLRREYGMNNVYYFPNFRITDFHPNPVVVKGVMKIVFFARINKMKGLDIVFYVAELLKNSNLQGKITIDFYGQIKEEDKSYFIDNVGKYEFVDYKGVLQPKEIHQTLSKYDVMLFPTKYLEDEGFPGTILDGYISGLPVIASNWCHSKDFVKDGLCGYICDINKPDEFYNKIIYLFENSDHLLRMKYNAYEESKQYSAENANKIISSFIK